MSVALSAFDSQVTSKETFMELEFGNYNPKHSGAVRGLVCKCSALRHQCVIERSVCSVWVRRLFVCRRRPLVTFQIVSRRGEKIRN